MDNTRSVEDVDRSLLTNVPITFNNIPESLTWIMKKLNEIEDIVTNRIAAAEAMANNEVEQPLKWFNVKELSEYLPTHPAVQTIYGWTCNNAIPYHKKGKRTFFLKNEIDEWISDEKFDTEEDMEQMAKAFIMEKKKKELQSTVYRR